MCDERMQKPDFQAIAAGTSLLDWRDIRRIRASFPINAQTLYCLKSYSFALWDWGSHELSCPDPACPLSFSAMASHVFWNCLVLGDIGIIYLNDGKRLAIEQS